MSDTFRGDQAKYAEGTNQRPKEKSGNTLKRRKVELEGNGF